VINNFSSIKIKISILMTVFIVISLSGCFSNWQGDLAKIVISFGGAERVIYKANDNETHKQLSHNIVFSNNKETLTFKHTGTGTFESFVAPGNWTVWVYSWLKDEVYAAGTTVEKEVNIQAGQDNLIKIEMHEAFLVSFESNGGSDVPDKVVRKGDAVKKPSDPKLDGHVFRGWYPVSEAWTVPLKTRYDFSKPVIGTVILYAKWDSIWWSWDSTIDGNEYKSKTKVTHEPTSNNSSCNVKVEPVSGNTVNNEDHNWASQVGYSYTATVGKTYRATWNWRSTTGRPFTKVTIRYAQDDYNDDSLPYDDSQYELGTDITKWTIPIETKKIETSIFTMPDNCYMNFTFMVGADTGSFEIRDFKIEEVEVKTITVPGDSLQKQLDWLKNNENVVDGGSYIVTVNGNQRIDPGYYFGCGPYDTYHVTITMNGGSVSLTKAGEQSMFGIDKNVTLILENITIQGRSDNHSPLVNVGGKLIMNKGVVITGNTNDGAGSGVWVSNGGSFTMNDGTISGNTADWGSGVGVWEGTFTMSGGTISGNTAKKWGGGGVNVAAGSDSVRKGSFTMSGGKISGNTATNGAGVHVSDTGTFNMSGDAEISGNKAQGTDKDGWYIGGGVRIESNSKFEMAGGTISGNTAYKRGGGVHVDSNSTFNMSGGKIKNNSITNSSPDGYGAGVRIDSATFTLSGSGEISGNNANNGGGALDLVNGTFTMTGGTISGNTTKQLGGGILVSTDATFDMKGGTISGNTAGQQGGGIYVSYSGKITKSGGTIYGYTSGNSNSNKVGTGTNVISNQGHAVYVDSDPAKRKETTSLPANKLDSTKSDAAGGWDSDQSTTIINIPIIQGVTAPAANGKPVTSIDNNDQYTGTVTWSPNHSTFTVSTVYTATISLTAKNGYTLQGVDANFFKVTGAASVTGNSSNSGVVTAVFPPADVVKGTYEKYASNDFTVLTSSAPYQIVNLSNGRDDVIKVSPTKPHNNEWAVALYSLDEYKEKEITITFSALVKRLGAAGALQWQINDNGNTYPRVTIIEYAETDIWYEMGGEWTGTPLDDYYLYLTAWGNDEIINDSTSTTYYIYNFTYTIEYK